MLEAPLPPDEAHRLRVLLDLNLLDTAPEERFDRITRMAARLFDVPIALIGLIDAKREWFKSRIGVTEVQIPRAITFCAHAILQDGTFVVEDALTDERFADNPYVTGSHKMRFYAGAPLAAPDGSHVGTLCLADSAPRRFSTEERALLRDLAAVVAHEFAADELRRALKEQRDSEVWLRALLDHLPEGMLMLDEERRVLSANPAAGQLFGTDPEALVGRSAQSFAVDAVAGIADAVPAGQVTTRQLTGRRLDGSTFPLELAVSAIQLGGRRRYAAIVRDITPRLEQAWRLRTASERRHKTFTLASHELRTPLASIIGFSELLLKREFDQATARELLGIVHTQATLMSTVITQVFDLARIEAGGRQALQITPEPIDTVLATALSNVQPEAQRARIRLDIAPGLPPVAADAYRLQMAFVNVLNNSIKYSDAGTPIEVQALADDTPGNRALIVRLRDHGVGMTPEQLERLFESFYCGAKHPDSEGVGLGMAIFKEIIDVHNGTVEVASAPGAGTTVSVRLPVAGEVPDA